MTAPEKRLFRRTMQHVTTPGHGSISEDGRSRAGHCQRYHLYITTSITVFSETGIPLPIGIIQLNVSTLMAKVIHFILKAYVENCLRQSQWYFHPDYLPDS